MTSDFKIDIPAKRFQFIQTHHYIAEYNSVQFIDLFSYNTCIYIKYLKIIKEKMARKPIKKPGGL